MATSNRIQASDEPFAAATNPAPRALLMFQAPTEKVPLPPGKGGAEEIDIGVVSE